jgi:hypothetical protein
LNNSIGSISEFGVVSRVGRRRCCFLFLNFNHFKATYVLIQALNADTRVLRPLLSQVLANIKSQSENQLLVISLNTKVVILFKQLEYPK